MANPFAARAARRDAAIGRAFGELFDFIPMVAVTDVNLPSVADATRPMLSGVIGVWEGATKSRLPTTRGAVQADTAQSLAISAPSVSIADADVTWMPIKGDLVRRQSDGSVYEISGPFPDSMGRTVLKLASKKRTAPIAAGFVPSLDFSDPRNSQYIPIVGVPVDATIYSPSLDFSDLRNSQYTSAVGI